MGLAHGASRMARPAQGGAGYFLPGLGALRTWAFLPAAFLALGLGLAAVRGAAACLALAPAAFLGLGPAAFLGLGPAALPALG
jgi:hypothetical protein